MAQRAEEGGVGGSGRGAGRGLWGEGPCSQAPRRLSAPRSPRPLPPGGGRLHLRPLPPTPSQGGETALDLAKRYYRTEVIKLLENPTAYFAAQVCRLLLSPPPLRLSAVPTPYLCGRSLPTPQCYP